jgi:hypothetical protein
MRPADPAKFNTIKARGLFDSSVISARYVLVIPTLLYKASISESHCTTKDLIWMWI